MLNLDKAGHLLAEQGTRAAGSPLMTKLESIASSAVRAADKVGASLIIVYTQSGNLGYFKATHE